jgi:hypothetical protein
MPKPRSSCRECNISTKVFYHFTVRSLFIAIGTDRTQCAGLLYIGILYQEIGSKTLPF